MTRRISLGSITSWGYMIGTTLLIPSTTLMLDAFSPRYYGTAILILIVSTAFLTASATLALVDQCRQAKPQRHAATDNNLDAVLLETGGLKQAEVDPPEPRRCSALWTWLYVWLMLAGGVFFLAASCMYLPAFANKTVGAVAETYASQPPPTGLTAVASTGGLSVASLGTWVFRAGTSLYIWGGTISLMRIAQSPGGFAAAKRVTTGVALYLVGAVVYFVGGALSQLQLPGFAATWVVGSVLFAAGSFAFVVPDIPCWAHCA